MYNFTVHVEYHEGKAAHFAGAGWRDCPYPQTEWPRRVLDKETCTWSGEIFSQWYKWITGWCDTEGAVRDTQYAARLQPEAPNAARTS